MDTIKQKELTVEWNSIKKINYRMYLIFIFLISQMQPYILWKKLFDFNSNLGGLFRDSFWDERGGAGVKLPPVLPSTL